MFLVSFVEKIKTHILCSIIFFENRAVYVMWKDILEWGRPHDNTEYAHCILDN